MRTLHAPVIAAWMLHRFGPMPETETIAGDLLEQYRQGRSRLWYWREVIAAVVIGTWVELRQHSLLLIAAIAAGWILGFVWQWIVTPFEYSLLVRYVLGGQASPQQIPFVGFLIEAPLAMAMGWTVARFARRCPIPAVVSFALTGLLVATWSIWKNTQIVWPESLGYHFSVWRDTWPLPLTTVLILLGGGLLTGSPKRSISTQ